MIVNLKERDGEALRELIAKADSYATHAMRTVGSVQPTLFIHSFDGRAMLLPNKFTSERSKDEFATAARLMCVAHGATAAVFVAEAWMAAGKEGQPVDLSRPPSQCPDRKEILMVMGETRYEANRRMLPILRTSSGRFMGLGESPMMDFDRMTGRFAQFLPENYPSMEVQQKAKELFQMVVEERGKERSAERGRDRGFARGED